MAWKSPVVPWADMTPEQQARVAVAWSRGDLAWKLSPNQRKVYDAIRASHKAFTSSAERWFVLDISRQFGKDFICGLIAIETLFRAAAKKEKGRFPYGAPTREAVRELLVPTLEELFVDCPPGLLPLEMRDGTFRKTANALTLTTGQRLVLVGLDVNPDRMRGPRSLGFAISEAGFVGKLDYVVEEVCLSQMIRVPGGFGLLNSTPPKTPQHTWSSRWVPDGKRRQTYVHRTILDNDMIDDEQKAGFIAALGGVDAEKCRRELFAEHIPDETLIIVPEWTTVRGKEDGHGGYTGGCVAEFAPPKYRDCYVAMDPGISDLCAALFAYYDFERDVLCIEDDFAVPLANTEVVAGMIRATETRLWRTRWEEVDIEYNGRAATTRKKEWKVFQTEDSVTSWDHGRFSIAPRKRVSDVDLRMITDLKQTHGIPFVSTRKDERDAQINNLRIRIQNRQIEIHPRCRNLIAHLDHGIWNDQRTEFARSGKFGHFDALAALVYLNRNIDYRRNPNPPYGHEITDKRMVVPGRKPERSVFAKMFTAVASRHERKQQGSR